MNRGLATDTNSVCFEQQLRHHRWFCEPRLKDRVTSGLFRRKRWASKLIYACRTDRQSCLLRESSRKIEKKGSSVWKRRLPLCYQGHHDNTSGHTALLVSFWQSTTWQRCHSPSIKTALKGHFLNGNEAIQATVSTTLNNVSVEAAVYRAWENC